ncbi:hypothetical protein [Microvirga yunnanensis]|uniref:hypothetical protein n=1 Tax=Microvirga yunnanensis TaxID=2953740 RepID=UPI0021CAD6CE|nr:hypothetical protein [Microvirga sp. HBU65207]
MHDKAATYRRRAQESRAVARWVSLSDERQKLLDDATRLEALAKIEERQGQPDRSLTRTFRAAEDPLLQRAANILTETSRLRASHQQLQAQVDQQVERMKQIGTELDPLLPHPYWELAVVRCILGHEKESAGAGYA